MGKDLANALRWSKEKHRGLNPAFRGLFLRGGEPPREGEILVQAKLAATLELIAAQGGAAMKSEPVATAICRTAREGGGSLSADDFRSLDAQVGEAASWRYHGATIWAPGPEQCGVSILFDALGRD